jgi:hypothetical protein
MMSRKKKVLEAYRAILAWMHRNRLQAGDKLPAQIPLGGELGICQGTLGAAMRFLVEDEVLIRKQKAGTVVRNLWPKNPHRRIWTAGIVMPELSESGYHAALTMELHRELARRHFSDRTYFISPHSMPASEVDVRQPSDFLGLETDLEEGLIDALVTSTRLSYDAIPCVALGSSPQSSNPASKLRVTRDPVYFFESSVRKLFERGCRHMFVVGAEPKDSAVSHRTAGQISPSIKITEIPMPSINDWTVESAAENFLRQATDNEPYGLIISDDFTASIFSRKIAQGSSLRPTVCLQTHGASQLSYALPALKYITDLQALSAAAVDVIINRLLGISSSHTEVRLPMIFREVEPQAIFPSFS